MKKKSLLLFVLGVFLFVPLSVFGADFDTIVVFGDSLSDNGNLLAATTTSPDEDYYWQGRFSNGPVWVEYLAEVDLLDATLVDNAYGGAETGTAAFPPDPPGLNTQVTAYTSTAVLGADTLFVIWIGANDMFAIADPADAAAVIGTAAANIQTALENLAAFGAENILILNLPNLGGTPRFYGTADAATATLISQTFNTSLAQVVSNFEAANPDITVYEMDIYALFGDLVANPGDYGFTNVTAVSPNFAVANEWDNSAGYAFWDEIHPTTEAHEAVAEEVYDLLNPAADNDGDGDNGCFIGSLLGVN